MNPERGDLEARQQTALQHLLAVVLAKNDFYRHKLQGLDLPPPEHFRLADLGTLPLTRKEELVADQSENPPYGTNLSAPLESYVRLHQTSGTTGKPLFLLDTAQTWAWWLHCWEEIYRHAGVHAGDRVFVAFSFGPFIGFWAAFEAAQRLGALVLSGGALSTEERLRAIVAREATVLLCTPTYALRLAEVARQQKINIRESAVRLSIHAGEPGASVANVKARIEGAWGARCVDHAGATEVGAWGVCPGIDNRMLILENEFIVEVVEPDSDQIPAAAEDGSRLGELVITNLGRDASPVIRYRTGDLVKLQPAAAEGPPLATLEGGVLSRIDGMFVVRGINVYPSAVENIVRELDEIDEFRVTVHRTGDLPRLALEVEVAGGELAGVVERLGHLLHSRLQLRAEIEPVAPGSLPRFELKARRFHTADTKEPGT